MFDAHQALPCGDVSLVVRQELAIQRRRLVEMVCRQQDARELELRVRLYALLVRGKRQCQRAVEYLLRIAVATDRGIS